jgi:hypothetical protein
MDLSPSAAGWAEGLVLVFPGTGAHRRDDTTHLCGLWDRVRATFSQRRIIIAFTPVGRDILPIQQIFMRTTLDPIAAVDFILEPSVIERKPDFRQHIHEPVD